MYICTEEANEMFPRNRHNNNITDQFCWEDISNAKTKTAKSTIITSVSHHRT